MQMTKDKIYYNEFYNALSEIDVIIEYIGISSIFPKQFLEFIKENKNESYKFIYDENISLNEQKVTNTTKQILAILYSEYFCTAEQKKELENIWKENEKIFEDKNKLNKNVEETIVNNSMIKYSEPFYRKILRKIKELIKFKKR